MPWENTYSEYLFMKISTNAYNFERRKKVLLNNKEKRQEEQEKKFIPNTKTPTFFL